MAEIIYEIIRSDRKSMALVVDAGAKLVVRAPLRAKVSDISDFVTKNARWIEEKQREAAKLNAKYSPVVFESGGKLPYLGETYAIQKTAVADVRILGANILVPEGYSQADAIAWLKSEAKALLKARVELFAGKMGLSYTCVRLSGAKTRWGSCGAKNSLNFAWRLIMCPLAIIDYVVVHELCHTVHKNHSRAFWASVAAILPDYKARKAWLKTNRRLMEII